MKIARSPLDGFLGIRLGADHVKNRAHFNAQLFNDQNGMRGIDTWSYIYGGKSGYTYHGNLLKSGEEAVIELIWES